MSSDMWARSRASSPAVDAPPALSAAALAEVPGVLGKIARERLEDYRDVPVGSAGDVRGDVALAARHEPPAFAQALRSPGLSIIAEIKRSSPSQGAIAPLDPVVAARAYRDGGAAALSVLTEPRHFGGKLEHLAMVREAMVSEDMVSEAMVREEQLHDRAALPILRKDFTVHPVQLLEARAMGASAVLLIVALTGMYTSSYLRFASDLGLDALVEVHDEAELDVALEAGAQLIGVNNRDLRSLEIDLATAPKLLAIARDSGYEGVLVAESGYRRREELVPLDGLAHAVLVGTSVAGSGDLAAAVRRLLNRD
ncbi:MAG: indole-3-glycerol phosphate synthase TrpC [Trueperaceae bacterium]